MSRVEAATPAQLRIESGEIRGWNAFRVIYPSNHIIYSDWRSRGRTQLHVNSDGTFDDDETTGGTATTIASTFADSGDGLDAHADLTIGVPKGQRIAVHWGVGDATVSQRRRRPSRERVGGVGDLRAHARPPDARHRIRQRHRSPTRKATSTLDTGSGDVTVERRARRDARRRHRFAVRVRGDDIDVRMLKVDVGSGGIVLDATLVVARLRRRGQRRHRALVPRVVDDLSVDAGSGGVTIRIPGAQGADVDIETGSGGIDSDFAVQTTRLSRDRLRGQIGDGKGRIKIESGSGQRAADQELASRDPRLARAIGELAARLDAEFREDVREMRARRARRDAERGADLLVRSARGDEPNDLDLARR